MKSLVMRLLTNSKLSYLSSAIGSLVTVFSIVLLFFTDLASELAGFLFILSVLLYTISWISYVWKERRILNTLVRESRSLRVEVAGWDRGAIPYLSEYETKMSRGFEDLEKTLRSSLDEYQKSYLEQFKIQAFNSHLAVQDLKSVICTERNYDA